MKNNPFHLLFGAKGKIVCEKILSFQRRFPHFLKENALRELGCYLSHSSESFLENRTTFLLVRIFLSFHRLMQKRFEKISLRAFKINSSTHGVALILSHENAEKFHEKHILDAAQKLISGIDLVPGSFVSYQYQTETLYYLEITKIRGGGFSVQENEKLQKELRHELERSIDSIALSLFLPGNEEELVKNIHTLSHEIKSIHDLPQVMITFVQYLPNSLKFLVIVVRAIKPSTPSLTEVSSKLPSLVQFSLEKVLKLGSLHKKYQKEATVFTLEVKSSPFIRNAQMMNLRAIRLYIAKVIESVIGPFRDYNGGLLNKENEQLLAIKSALQAKGLSHLFLEELFYSIKPIGMCPLLTPETGVEIVSSFQKMLDTPLPPSKKYATYFSENKEVHVALVKTRELKWKTNLPPLITAYSSQIGYSAVEREGYLYLCFFHQYPQAHILFEVLEKELKEQSQLSTYRNIVLNINFQSGDPLSLNPRMAADMPSHILANFLFEGLVRVDSKGKTEPAAAEKIEISSCQTVYTFYLRSTKWSNGEEVLAYHFEKAWKKALMAALNGYPFPDFFFLIKNVEKARAKELSLNKVGIEVKDAKTLQVTLEMPCPYFLNLTATPPFFPLLDESEEPKDFNGPFTLAEWKRNAWIHLSQNPFYRDAHHIKICGIKISMVKNPYTAYEMFQKGELHFIGDPISPLPPDILKRPEIEKDLFKKQISRIFWIHCNQRKFPLNNKLLRRALSLSLNRKKIVERVFFHQMPQVSPLPAKYAQVKGLEEGDPNFARILFEKALNELNLTAKSFPTLTVTHSDLSFEKPLFEELRSQWKEVLGIEIVSQHLRWNDFSAAIEKGNFQLCGLFRRDFFNNPLFYLNFFKAAPTNPHYLENKEYANLLQILNKGDTNREIVKKMENLLIDESPVIPLVNQTFLALTSNKISGIGWEENGCLNLKDVWIK